MFGGKFFHKKNENEKKLKKIIFYFFLKFRHEFRTQCPYRISQLELIIYK